MRTREEIEANYFQNKYRGYATTDDERFALLMEVLLDIRDLLTKEDKEV